MQKQKTQDQNIDTSDFRRYLQMELVRRCEKNPQYSLRAFAKSLGIYHATLSALLAGRRPISSKTTRFLAEPLGLTPEQVKKFEPSRLRKEKVALKPTDEFKELTLDIFAATSEWYHDAILELTHIQGFSSEPAWIAKKLGLTVSEVKIAIERLTRLELLTIDKRGRLKESQQDTTTILHNDFTSAALRKFQKKILQMSLASVDEVPKPMRDHTSVTIAVQSGDLDEIKNKIKSFRRELIAFVQRSEVSPDEVYQLAISFFPLTQISKKEGENR